MWFTHVVSLHEGKPPEAQYLGNEALNPKIQLDQFIPLIGYMSLAEHTVTGSPKPVQSHACDRIIATCSLDCIVATEA